MQKDEFITRMVKEGLGDCPSMSTILIFSRNEKVGQEDSEHIELCPLCQKKLGIINEDENLRDLDPSFFEVDVDALNEIKEIVKKKKTEKLLDKDTDDLEDDEVVGLFSHLIEQGVSAAAFSLSDLEKLDSIEVKRQLIKFLKERLKK